MELCSMSLLMEVVTMMRGNESVADTAAVAAAAAVGLVVS